ncbi:Mitochondrial translocator assembly and maintenance protein 41 [Phlyctochytrium planicorne]|nr:Mitochondrial translocator assembly and maintenance protein 41 [Phlyctochytrium planicorne]
MLALTRRLSTAPTPPSTTFWANDTLASLLDAFHAPVRFAAGYGSGVFKQASYEKAGRPGSKQGPMIDLIFGVTHPEHWHSLNIRQYPHHYSFLKSFGSRAVTVLQDNFGAGVYFNTDVMVKSKEGDVRVKYGVVSMDRGDSRVKLANDSNLENAVRIALLSLPTEFTEEDFFKAIVSISYTGDFRMLIAENPRKIHNIVVGQIGHLRTMYKPIVENCPNIVLSNAKDWDQMSLDGLDNPMRQDDDIRLRSALVSSLPKKIKDHLLSNHANDSDPTIAAVSSIHITASVSKAITKIVKPSAFSQSAKGLLTAGPTRSFRYVGEKVSKRFK